MGQGHTGGNGGGGRTPATGLSRLVHAPDLRIALLILAVCAVLYLLTTRFEQVPDLLAQSITAQWFPRLLIWTTALLALLLPFEHLFRKEGKAELDEERQARVAPMSFFTALVLFAVVGAMTLIGTFGALVLTSAGLPLLWGERRLGRLCAYALLFPTAVTLVFTQLLKVYFEHGVLWELLP